MSVGRWTSRALLLVVALALTGCGGAPKAHTPFLRSVDLVEMTDRMAQSFVGAPQVGEGDETWVISIARIVNHTNQLVPDREKWLYIGRLRAQLDRSGIGAERGLVWIVPPERWPMLREELTGEGESVGLRLEPTHLLTATFSALTTTSGAGRSDTYLCAYELIELADGRIVWTDAWEVKREVVGRTYD